MPKQYEDTGYIYTPDAEDGGDTGRVRMIVKCLLCGALVNGGGLSRQKHTDFHTALADLFNTLADIQDELDTEG